MSAPPEARTEEEDLKWLRESIGPMTTTQEAELRTALAENAAGVHALAAAVAGDPNVRSPIAVVLHGVREGKHQATPRQPRARKTRITAPLDAAHKLFTGKLRDLNHTDWDEQARIEFAIDYALDHCGAYGQAIITTEQQLRSELHAPRWNGQDTIPDDPAKNTEHARLMAEAHRVVSDDDLPIDWDTTDA